ncbi:hypothetical protein CcrC1_gp227c [Caulobacter phage C1]|nr:hypothetical protein CcrC1_gp227c [Caulobacter phage C1]UTU08456.1 hypothetical protein CcrC2_gp228c [Caulobacter phage C2]UTU08973.1 hypothetical protein CcrJ4_gp222c [Caulobacter phage J4]UTU09532.1 hypothetical protein CcrBL47_gp246c [Caulobacter phage BL47]UTU10089.1 hypothetical protein CcrRB23_gp227c [Caulobacter phage RB23]WGN97124.1 hypothetical protein [Bertelyvirus sp.]
MHLDETRQELAERMAQELDVSVTRALVAIDNLIAKGLISLTPILDPCHRT